MREQAAAEAVRRREAAERMAAETVDQARAAAPRVREQSAARIHDATAAEAAALLATAERDVAALRDRVEHRLPPLVDRVVAGVIEDLSTPDDERRERGSPR
ncbi:hypothetical protein [Streptomyces sp. NPDC097981]|uniref:hypothetical protein n=1 Tax=Streptomyces sp. NPDC097981 TaxID=3155428 RepID=UPI0033315CB3